ncbi:MAG TPA: PAS domain-containing protein, partial [Thermoanaerobaculia bacterium]|nr:PAS domain-containing protein [Thermoanaerobaculia bacterium]
MASERAAAPVRRRPRRIAFRGLFRRARPALAFEDRVLLLALGIGLPGAALSMFFVYFDPHSIRLRLTVTLFVLYFWVWFALRLRDKVVRPLQTFANLLSALREGDFSQRAHPPQELDALAQVVDEINAIGEVLREQRLGAVEAAALLHRVVAEVDVAVFAFDDSGKLRLVNRAGERLLGEPGERLVGRTEEELGLADLLERELPPILSRTFASGPGRWEVRSTTFREGGLPHRLLVISDLS